MNRAEVTSGRTTDPVEGPAIIRELKDAADAAEDITNSRTLELVARAGYCGQRNPALSDRTRRDPACHGRRRRG